MKLQNTKDEKFLDIQRETTGFILKMKNWMGVKLQNSNNGNQKVMDKIFMSKAK